MILNFYKLTLLCTFSILIYACHTTKEVTSGEVKVENNSGDVVTEDTTIKNAEDTKNPNAKVKEEISKECFDKTFANPSMICDNENTPVCGCNNINYKNPCEAEKVGVRYYNWGKCTKAAKTGAK